MRCVVGVSMGSWAVRAAVMDPLGRVLLGSETVRDCDSDRSVGSALSVVESVAHRHLSDPRAAVVVVPDDPASRVGRNILTVHDAGSVRLASELGAQLMYLRLRGLIGPSLTVAVVDIGHTATRVSILDSSTGFVHAAQMSARLRGELFARTLAEHLLSTSGSPSQSTDYALERLDGGVEWALEMLAEHSVVRVGGPFTSGSVAVSRTTVARVTGAQVAHMARWSYEAVQDSPRPVQAVALLGGCANLPSVREGFLDVFGAGLVVVPSPESVSAKGAALLATQRVRSVARRSMGRTVQVEHRMPRHAGL